MASAPEEGGGFDDMPPLDDEWIKKASKREQSAEDRAARLRRIAAEHERLQREAEADRQSAMQEYRRDRWRPWIIVGAIIAVLVVVFILI